jgi:cytochrome b6-f complex iron-sulfur subunit
VISGRALRRYVEDLLRGQRPRGFPATDDDVAELRAAIALRAARPGDDAPRGEFVAALHQQLAAELADPQPIGRARAIGRRGLMAGGAALAAASAAIGVLVDRIVIADRDGARPDAGRPADTLTPAHGDWRTVAASDELPDGAVRAFDMGAVAGFVLRSEGVVRAVSGMCSHQGCRLLLNATSRQLDCPCHTTVFALTGELVAHQLPVPPGPLPRIAARELDGAVQVYTPSV